MTRSVRLSEDGKTLTINIDGEATDYALERLDPDTEVANPAFNLKKSDGEVYHVWKDAWGIHCTCASYEFSKSARKHCKHTDGMIALKLLTRKSE